MNMDTLTTTNDSISLVEVSNVPKVNTEIILDSKSASSTIPSSNDFTTPKVSRLENLAKFHTGSLLPAFRTPTRGLCFPPVDDYAGTSTASSISCHEPELQRTLAIIKPDGLQYKDVVLRAINEAGLKILNQRLLHLSPEQVSDIYSKHYGSPSFPHLVVSLSISPLLVLSLAGKNAVEKWKTMIGPYGQLREEWFYPYSVRTRFGIQPDIPDVIHASETIADAKWENRYFYPRSILEPITADEAKVNDYLKNWVCPTLQEGLIQVVHMKPINPILFLAEWLLLNNPYQPKFPERIAVSPL
ncbi:nucleoside diphosphate kinase homolog 5 [Leptinotarsa decemlineata]|uniref:nucleoside diphosphate kinase homolog 5 n=1 Tax=Leptinotarsa decemlineata TaxID=7539 RepID=UPI003D30C81E